MTQKSYFVVNDTRYDNHHGGLRVMANLHLAMEKRGWQCTGSLPVSTKPEHLNKSIQTIKQTDLIIVNGEGSLHHNSRNATRLYNILSTVTKERPIALINALWQGNDSAQWQPLLASFAAIYAAKLATHLVERGSAS